ncbi:MAG: type 2 isopentenyl-diphosphate Delta-isomerase [Lentisphaeria bacterium]|nr:type 2 isopentenyl-diphosphate Delta-isomerase [Lentisphaeria bacterium]
MTNELVNQRKLEHLNVFEQDPDIERKQAGWEDIQLTHRALPQIDFDKIDTRTTFLNKKLSFPLLISSMTGGEHSLIQKINENLAIAAEACNVAMGVGSQRVMLTNPEAAASFSLRKLAPNTLLFANLGAVQLNYGVTYDDVRKCIDVLEADALILHLNPLQEVIQEEGDRNFAGLLEKMSNLQSQLSIPVIIKEVGAGISEIDAKLLMNAGFSIIDVAGRGGTSWARIEEHRKKTGFNEQSLGLLFQDWGIPTPIALKKLQKFIPNTTLIGSGGIRSGLDMLKATILGASLCGVAAPLLTPAKVSPEATINAIEELKKQYQIAMFLLGACNVSDVFNNNSYILTT